MTDLDFSIEDIRDREGEDNRLCKKIEKNPDYARTVCWLALVFIKQNRQWIESKELADQIIKKAHSTANRILNEMVTYELIKRHIPLQKIGTSYKFLPNDKNRIVTFLPISKRVLGLNKKAEVENDKK